MKKQLWNFGWEFCNLLRNTDPVMVDLPFDAMQTEERIPGMKGGAASGYYPGGKYSYTKKLFGAPEYAEQVVMLEFEGIYQKSEIYLNGEKIGGRIYGYSDFLVDLTGRLKVGCDNEIKVIADNSQQLNSRWYTGSGIYRDVYLLTSEKNHIRPDGVRVTTVGICPATLRIQVDAVMEPDMTVETEIVLNGQTAAVVAGRDAQVEIPEAKLWDAENPNLYDVIVRLTGTDGVVDEARERIGIRSLEWDAKRGLRVNGAEVKLRGGCVHHDHGVIGACSFAAAEKRRAYKMKQAGFNAVRCAHNPAGRAFLDACDEIGLYVMDEAFDVWLGTKNTYDYSLYITEEWEQDIKDMIRIAYNHPSVIMYSIGNEVYLKPVEEVVPLSDQMAALCHKLDKGRPVLNSVNPMFAVMTGKKPDYSLRDAVVDPYDQGEAEKLKGSLLVNVMYTVFPRIRRVLGSERAMVKLNRIFAPLDIVGFNYGDHLYEAQHRDYPDRVLVSSESMPSALAKNWGKVKRMPWVIGDFCWTAWDYLGEAGIGMPDYTGKESFQRPYPCISAGCSNIDMTGETVCQGYYAMEVWEQLRAPWIAVHPVQHSGEKVVFGMWRLTDAVHSWSFCGQNDRKAKVDVYAAGESVELFQDGKSLGKKKIADYMATYDVPYRPGILTAVNYDGHGKKIGEDVLKSAGQAVKLSAVPEKTSLRADGMDLLYVPVEICDENGVREMLADCEIMVSVEGTASLLGVGSADPNTEYPYTGTCCKTYYGRMISVFRAGKEAGEVKITYSAKGLRSATVVVRVEQ